MIDNKIPPQNIEAEQAIIGSILLDPPSWDEIVDLLNENDFYKPSHRRIFSCLKEMNQKNLPTDLVTLGNWLNDKGELEGIGGIPYLVELVEQTPTSLNIVSWANIVRDKSMLRTIIHLNQKIMQKAYSQEFEDLPQFINQFESEVFALNHEKQPQGLMQANEIIRGSLEKLESLYGRNLTVTGIPSGWAELDDLTSGFQSGELCIIAARPSMGKTAFCLNLACHASIKLKKRVALFSVEMSSESVMMRLLSFVSRISMSHLRVAQIGDEGWPKLINAAALISESGLHIDDSSGISPFEILAKCRRMKAKHGLDMIIIDYLQLMNLKSKVDNREREVSEISKALKAIAKELKVPVIALAQLNRGVEGRQNRRPMLSDLRESGSIEQDADVIMMLYREDYYEKENPDIRGIAEVIIGKQRNGPTDTVKLLWKPEFGEFRNFEEAARGPLPPLPEQPYPSDANYHMTKKALNPKPSTAPKNYAPFQNKEPEFSHS